MRKQRQRIDEQQIMHYFVQILQASDPLRDLWTNAMVLIYIYI